MEPLTMIDETISTPQKEYEPIDDFPTQDDEIAITRQPVRAGSVVSAASVASAFSSTSYDLQPVHLVIPQSPEQPFQSHNSSASPKSSASDGSTQLPSLPPIYRVKASARTMSSGLTCPLNTFVANMGQMREDSSSSSSGSSVSPASSSGLFPGPAEERLRDSTTSSRSSLGSGAYGQRLIRSTSEPSESSTQSSGGSLDPNKELADDATCNAASDTAGNFKVPTDGRNAFPSTSSPCGSS